MTPVTSVPSVAFVGVKTKVFLVNFGKVIYHFLAPWLDFIKVFWCKLHRNYHCIGTSSSFHQKSENRNKGTEVHSFQLYSQRYSQLISSVGNFVLPPEALRFADVPKQQASSYWHKSLNLHSYATAECRCLCEPVRASVCRFLGWLPCGYPRKR